jgi:hypothetical protein
VGWRKCRGRQGTSNTLQERLTIDSQ